MILIEPSRGWRRIDLPELWRHRGLIYFLALRDVKLRYRQTLFGAGWTVIQPVLAMLAMTMVFRRFVGSDVEGVAYPLFLLSGLVPWFFFSSALSKAVTSVLANEALIDKVYFPRLAIPIASVLGGLVDLAVATCVLLLAMVWYGSFPGWAILITFPLLAYITALAIGCGSALTALSVRFRDIQHVLPFIIQLGLFLTPIIYPMASLSPKIRMLLAFNPLSGPLEAMRWALLGLPPGDPELVALSFAIGVLLIPCGLLLFRRLEPTFADVI